MAQRDAVFPEGRHDLYETYGYSAAISSGDFLFVSGQVGSDPDGSPLPDFDDQVRLAFANLEATLAGGGCAFDDIVDVTTFHTDPENQFPTVLAVKKEVFPKAPYPNWTALGVNWLAGFDFEIKVIARIPGNAEPALATKLTFAAGNERDPLCMHHGLDHWLLTSTGRRSLFRRIFQMNIRRGVGPGQSPSSKIVLNRDTELRVRQAPEATC